MIGTELRMLREWQPTPAFLPGESHGQRSLVGYSPWGLKETDWLHFDLFKAIYKQLILSQNKTPHPSFKD